MKKLFTLVIIFNGVQGFSQNFFYRYDNSTWYSLFVYGVLFFGIMSYLFIKYKFEQIQRNKNTKVNDEVNHNSSILEKTSASKTGSQELLNLFLLKRKGVISEFEYHQLKQRALKSKTSSFNKLEGAALAH